MNRPLLKDRWRKWRLDFGAFAGILLVFAVAFGWAIFRGWFLIGGDVFFYTYPMRTVAWRMIRSGIMPTWTPLILSGYPLLAMVQLGLGYPITWLHLFVPDHWAEECYVLAPFVLAPLFTYCYARQLDRGRLASLLAGLAFGYGGLTTNTLGMNGIPTNAMMWLPLMLIALERARFRFLNPLLGASAAYSLSVLTGHAQSFLFVGALSAAYALFLTIVPLATKQESTSKTQLSRWRPLLITGLAALFSVGVAAFQILETTRAAQRSIRSQWSYDFFSQGSFTPTEALRSFTVPLLHYIDVSTYVVPLAAGLALYVVGVAIRSQLREARIYFWLATAIIAGVLMLGENFPLYRLLYRLPVLNLFRIPSRHAFEWTFAISILAAYGWDGANENFARLGDPVRGSKPLRQTIVAIALVLSLTAALVWFSSVNALSSILHVPGVNNSPHYLAYKAIFTASLLLLGWCSYRLIDSRGRQVLLGCLLIMGCMCEPWILITQWWRGTAKSSLRFSTPARATKFLQDYPPQQNRIYTRANLGVDENAASPRFDVLNQTAPYGLHNVGGYEPFLFERYSRALGNVDYDAVRPRAGYSASDELFQSQSHVLDLLNTRFVVGFSDIATSPAPAVIKHQGIDFAVEELARELKPDETTTLICQNDHWVDSLLLVTTLANSVLIGEGAPVATVRLTTTGGDVVERQLHAGVDTAEWAHERNDVRPNVKHKLAPIFDSQPSDPTGFVPYRFLTRLQLGKPVAIKTIEIRNISTEGVSLALWKASLYDSVSMQSFVLTNESRGLDSRRWKKVDEFEDGVILENQRAMPRAWLVTDVKAVDANAALRYIRGKEDFDPRRTALLEVAPDDLPIVTPGELPSSSGAVITDYRPNSLRLETSAPMASVLVVSEIFYPGWTATVDGQPARILPTDYLLRGIALSPGSHQVEMQYAPATIRYGLIISTCSLITFFVLALVSWRQRTQSRH